MVADNLPRKALGQHWLESADQLAKVVEAANIEKNDTILEVGPGHGSLTKLLVQRARHVVAVELDRQLALELSAKIKAENLQVYNLDILKFDLGKLEPGYKVVANIPYYLTSKLLRRLSEAGNSYSVAVLLVQKEVAERIAAGPGAMSLLSISVQYYSEVQLGPVVAAEYFIPPPKVDSQVIILRKRVEPLFPDVESKVFFRIVKAGYSQRRKTLLNSLSAGLRLDKTIVQKLIQKSDLLPSQRPQTLALTDWHRLYENYQSPTAPLP